MSPVKHKHFSISLSTNQGIRGKFVEQKLELSCSLGVTEFITIIAIVLVTHFVGLLKSNLDVQQTHLRGQFVEQKLELSCSLDVAKFFKPFVFI